MALGDMELYPDSWLESCLHLPEQTLLLFNHFTLPLCMHISDVTLTSLLLHGMCFWLSWTPKCRKVFLPRYVPLQLFLTPLSVQTGRMANMDVTPLALTSAAAATQLPVGRQLHQVLCFACSFNGNAVASHASWS